MSERFCYCGAPLPKGRSKYCSEECGRRMYNSNICAPKEDDEVVKGYENMPEQFVGIWMLPGELRARNRELAKHGRRICRTHQGAALPLDDQHFAVVTPKTGRMDTECRECRRKRCRESERRRRQNPLHMERKRAIDRANYRRHRTRYIAVQRAYVIRRKREQFARVLGVAS